MSVPIQFRYGTEAEWNLANPVLREGELGVQLGGEFQQFKMGDGATPWADLDWALKGDRGYGFDHEWDGTTLKVKDTNATVFTTCDLGLMYIWDGTRLGVKNSDDTEYVYSDLQGEKGDKPEHEWVDTSLKVQNPDGTWGSLVNLKGDTGNPADLGEGMIWRGNSLGVAEQIDGTALGKRYLTRNTTMTLDVADMNNSVISNYGQTEDIELTLPTAGAGMCMEFQYDHIGHDVVFKSGDGVIPIIDYVVRGAGFNFKKYSPLLGEIGVFRTVQIGADAWRWVVESGETGFFTADPYVAKSVILDIADNWGYSFLGFRAIQFYLAGELIAVETANIEAYATTCSHTTYNHPRVAFITTNSLIGDDNYNEWVATKNTITNQRLMCVFDTPIVFDSIVIHNYHDGASIRPTGGVKNVKINISTDAITDTTYNASISNSQLIFDGQFRQHVAQNIEDPEALTLI